MEFVPGTRAVVLTVSDRCWQGVQVDRSGPAVVRRLREAGIDTVEMATVPDEVEQITASLRTHAEKAQLIVTTGGTGLAARDVTPEATRLVCGRMVDGLAELMRAQGLKQTPMAALSRAVCGTLGTTLILNLPGSPSGAESSLSAVLHLFPHALDLLAGRTEHPTEAQNSARPQSGTKIL